MTDLAWLVSYWSPESPWKQIVWGLPLGEIVWSFSFGVLGPVSLLSLTFSGLDAITSCTLSFSALLMIVVRQSDLRPGTVAGTVAFPIFYLLMGSLGFLL